MTIDKINILTFNEKHILKAYKNEDIIYVITNDNLYECSTLTEAIERYSAYKEGQAVVSIVVNESLNIFTSSDLMLKQITGIIDGIQAYNSSRYN